MFVHNILSLLSTNKSIDTNTQSQSHTANEIIWTNAAYFMYGKKYKQSLKWENFIAIKSDVYVYNIIHPISWLHCTPTTMLSPVLTHEIHGRDLHQCNKGKWKVYDNFCFTIIVLNPNDSLGFCTVELAGAR